MVFGSLFPLFLIVFLMPMIMGKTLEQFDDVAEGAANRQSITFRFGAAAQRTPSSPADRAERPTDR